MDNIFNIKRFGNFFISDMKKCLSNYGITLGLLTIIELIAFAFIGAASFVTTGEWFSIGPGTRLCAFGLGLTIMILSLPSKCYGSITDKRSGSEWLMLPVSTFEKYLSMILNTTIILPAIYFFGTMLVDLLLCAIIPDCGASFFSMRCSLKEFLTQEISIQYSNVLYDLCNPALYIDDFIGTILMFLLGATIFKKNKSVMTIISIIIISSAIGMIAIPFTMSQMNNIVENMAVAGDPLRIFESPLFSNMALLDTINDQIVIIGTLIAIFFRIKTLKH